MALAWLPTFAGLLCVVAVYLCALECLVSATRSVVYTTLSRALRVQGIYCASVSNIDSAVAGTAYVLCAEPFILWLPRLQMEIRRTLYIFVTH